MTHIKKSTWLFLVLLLGSAPEVTAQEFALEQLLASPRHHEWVEIPSSDGRTIHSFVAYPEASNPTLAVIVIHENRGLTDWVRSFTDQVAEAGFLAIAPDLLSGFDDNHARTTDFATSDDARNAIYQLDPDQTLRDLDSVMAFIQNDPASDGRTVVVGFCWGGSQAFRYVAHAEELAAAMVFYGSAPTEEDQISTISAPVYAFYGENDERINATIPETERLMSLHGKTYDYQIYDGAGHAFMRSGDDPQGSPENRRAKDDSWERLRQILAEIR